MPVNARQRQFMQPLRSLSWMKAGELSESPTIVAKLLANGWIEKRGAGGSLEYRLTDTGLAALKAPVQV
jgi:hypothetical protein